MPAGNWIVYDSFKAALGDPGVDIDGATIKVALFTDSYAPDRSSDAVWADISAAEVVSDSNGYTAGGATLANSAWGQTSGVATLTADSPSWVGEGSGIADVMYAVVYLDDGVDDALVCYCQLDDEVIEVLDGQTLAINLPDDVILRLSGAVA
jgi:hypothetical protein